MIRNRWFLPLLLTLISAGFAGEPVAPQVISVSQLEQSLSGPREGDRDLARRIAGLKLTQRLSPERFNRLSAALPGARSREALLVVADLSAFFDLPDADVPADPPPDAAAQRQILSRAVDYVARTTHRLPDFFATRRLTRFEDLQVVRGVEEPAIVRSHPFERVDRSSARVLFRDGRESVEPLKHKETVASYGLEDRGIFASLLSVVMTDMLKGRAGFDHWENGPRGRVAVFRYVVGEDQSHYEVKYCCFTGRDGLLRNYEAVPQYHGEISVEPETGAIVRVLLKTDLNRSPLLHIDTDSDRPLMRADTVVEYGPVVIGGSSYICPMRSISIQTSWTRGSQGPAAGGLHMEEAGGLRTPADTPLDRIDYSRVTAVNDYVFEDHHLFRGEMRMVPDSEAPAGVTTMAPR